MKKRFCLLAIVVIVCLFVGCSEQPQEKMATAEQLEAWENAGEPLTILSNDEELAAQYRVVKEMGTEPEPNSEITTVDNFQGTDSEGNEFTFSCRISTTIVDEVQRIDMAYIYNGVTYQYGYTLNMTTKVVSDDYYILNIDGVAYRISPQLMEEMIKP